MESESLLEERSSKISPFWVTENQFVLGHRRTRYHRILLLPFFLPCPPTHRKERSTSPCVGFICVCLCLCLCACLPTDPLLRQNARQSCFSRNSKTVCCCVFFCGAWKGARAQCLFHVCFCPTLSFPSLPLLTTETSLHVAAYARRHERLRLNSLNFGFSKFVLCVDLRVVSPFLSLSLDAILASASTWIIFLASSRSK